MESDQIGLLGLQTFTAKHTQPEKILTADRVVTGQGCLIQIEKLLILCNLSSAGILK
jgi:hypothetical protein